MAIADDTIDQARTVPIEGELARRGIKLRKSGKERIGPCPKCGGTDRFSFNVEDQLWNCRQCKPETTTGDVIGLVQWLDGVTFKAAVERLTGERPSSAEHARVRTNGAHAANGAEPPRRRKQRAPLGPIVATFDYNDETGALRFQVTKHNPKDFRQRRPDGQGGWIDNTDGVAMLPYQAAELAEAIALERTVFIVEGEKDVDNVRRLGAPATCNPRGAGNWASCEIDHYFHDAHVVVIADNDSQSRNKKTGELLFHPDGRPRFAGWDHALEVAAHLEEIAASVRVVDLKRFWPDCPDKGDISDWIEAGGTIEALNDIAARAPLWPAIDARPDPRHIATPFEAILFSTRSNHVVKGIIPRETLVIIWGPPKCGKSFFTFDLVMHVALGRPYRGRRVKQGTVVYLALEGAAGFSNRVEAWRRKNLNGHAGPVPFYLLDVPIDIVADHAALIASLKAQGLGNPSVLVIDTLNRAMVGDENKSDDMAKFIRAADAIRRALGCAVLIVHHCGVAGTRPRGHTSLTGADDAQIAVLRDKDGTITVRVEHMKDGDASAPMGCRLARVELGQDDDGDEISSCVIEPAELKGKAAAGKKLPAAVKLALEQLQLAIIEAGKTPEPSSRIPPRTMVATVDVWREYYCKKHPADKPDSRTKAFARAVLSLQEEKLIGIWGAYAWLVHTTGHPDIAGHFIDSDILSDQD